MNHNNFIETMLVLCAVLLAIQGIIVLAGLVQ
jgi:hypothetical protein